MLYNKITLYQDSDDELRVEYDNRDDQDREATTSYIINGCPGRYHIYYERMYPDDPSKQSIIDGAHKIILLKKALSDTQAEIEHFNRLADQIKKLMED